MGALKFFLRNYFYWRTNALPNIIGDVIDPLIYLVGFGYGLSTIIGDIDGVKYISFIAPGIVMSSVMTSACYEGTFGTFTRMATRKVYTSVLLSPISIDEIVIGDILWSCAKGILSGIIVIIFILILGIIESDMFWLNTLNIVITALVFSSISMFFSSISRSYEFFSYFFTLFISPMYIFSGVFFPISSFPDWVNYLSLLLPLTYSVKISRGLFFGDFTPLFIGYGFILIATFIIFTFLSIYFIRRRLIL